MTNNNQPITPPPELQEQWKQEWLRVRPAMTPCIQWMLAKSAQWGYEQRGADIEDDLQKARDEELEACCEWLDFNYPHVCITMLRADRRPEPKTQAEEALEALDRMDQLPMDQLSTAKESQRTSRFVELKNYKEDHAIVRRALERLQELEESDE